MTPRFSPRALPRPTPAAPRPAVPPRPQRARVAPPATAPSAQAHSIRAETHHAPGRIEWRPARLPLPRFPAWAVWDDGTVHPLLDIHLALIERSQLAADLALLRFESWALLTHSALSRVLTFRPAYPGEVVPSNRATGAHGIRWGLRDMPPEVWRPLRAGDMDCLMRLAGWREIQQDEDGRLVLALGCDGKGYDAFGLPVEQEDTR